MERSMFGIIRICTAAVLNVKHSATIATVPVPTQVHSHSSALLGQELRFSKVSMGQAYYNCEPYYDTDSTMLRRCFVHAVHINELIKLATDGQRHLPLKSPTDD